MSNLLIMQQGSGMRIESTCPNAMVGRLILQPTEHPWIRTAAASTEIVNLGFPLLESVLVARAVPAKMGTSSANV